MVPGDNVLKKFVSSGYSKNLVSRIHKKINFINWDMPVFMRFAIIIAMLILFLSSGHLWGNKEKTYARQQYSTNVPGSTLWKKTYLKLKQGDHVLITAKGKVEISGWSFFGRDGYDYIVGPEGTYNFSPKIADKDFPMPSANQGPVPCYSLIGKINEDGKPFFIGKKRTFVVPENGTLYLGINDFKCTDNKGGFNVSISKHPEISGETERLRDKRRIETSIISAANQDNTDNPKVLLIYIDGLTYDVLKEMVFEGYLPNIKKFFFDKGTEFENTFTIFPASTFQSVASTLTGMYTDVTGIKYEMFFDREKEKVDHFFKPFGPNTSARLMRPEFWGKLQGQRPEPVNLMYDYVKNNNLNYKSTILPIQHDSPPTHIMQTISNTRYLGAHTVHYNLDKINEAYALEYVVKKENDFMFVWLPGPDVSGHTSARGLWGPGRRDLSTDDEIIGRLMEKLKKEGIFGQTYKILFSDHGHHGGRDFINQNFDISNDFFYKSIFVKNDEIEEDSGLGFNVRFAIEDKIIERAHGNTDKNNYMVSAVEGFGMANIYLPYQSKYSKNMKERNNLYDLTHYTIYPDLPPVNILEMILSVDLSESNKYPDKVSSNPVDIVLLKLDEHRVLLLKNNGTQAIIERKQIDGAERSFRYRYKVISGIKQDANGNVTYEEDDKTIEKDPLDYFSDPHIKRIVEEEPDWFEHYHTADEWLDATAFSQYPDAVVQFSHFFLWDSSIKDREWRNIPDFVVIANRGWNLRADGVSSTDHGYPFEETVRIPLFISGPGIKQGAVVKESRRVVDILPTVLDILQIEYNEASLDGTSLYDNRRSMAVDKTKGKKKEYYRIGEETGVFHHTTDAVHEGIKEKGISLHDYDNPYDLHNVAANVKLVFDLSILKVGDDILDFIIPGNKVQPIETGFDMGTGAIEKIPDNIVKKRFTELLSALRIRHFSVSDISIFLGNYANEGNYHRANSLIDWSQNVMGDFNKLLGAPIYKFEKGLIPGKSINKYLIDYPQSALKTATKSFTELAGRVVFKGIFSTEYGIGKLMDLFKEKRKIIPEIVFRR